jgi:hypothetical protein
MALQLLSWALVGGPTTALRAIQTHVIMALQLLSDAQSVGLLGRGISPSQADTRYK